MASLPMSSQNAPPATRARILAMLEQSAGWCSGEDISASLGISRAAVAKHMAGLRMEGHSIAALTRRGYRLLAKRDALGGDVLAAALRTRVFGKKGWLMLEETTSTSHEAVRLADGGAEEGHVVLAERQTHGRGRKGRGWLSLPRGLQFSIILRPVPQYWDAEQLTRLAATAVARAIAGTTALVPEFVLPHEVLLKGKKVAGVLVETGFRGSDPAWAVLGVGCNVNAVQKDFPAEARNRITSIFVESGRFTPRPPLLAAMLEELESRYDLMQHGSPAEADGM